MASLKSIILCVLVLGGIQAIFAIKCYKYICRGDKCNEFRNAPDKNRFLEVCPSKSTGCSHRRGNVTTRRGEYAPPVLEERICWDSSIPGLQGRSQTTCSMKGGGNAYWNINGKTVDVDIAEDQCLCFQDLCNGQDLPTGGAGKGRGQLGIAMVGGIIGVMMFLH